MLKIIKDFMVNKNWTRKLTSFFLISFLFFSYGCEMPWDKTTGTDNTHIITAKAGTGGSISPSGTIRVNDGADELFEIIPNSGYEVADIKVNGIITPQSNPDAIIITKITTDCTLEVTFKKQPVIPPNTDCWIEVRNLYFGETLDYIKYNGQYAMYSYINQLKQNLYTPLSFGDSVWIKVDEAHQGVYPIRFYTAKGNFFTTVATFLTAPGKIVTVEINGNTLVTPG